MNEEVRKYNMLVSHHESYDELKKLQDRLEFFLRNHSYTELFGNDMMWLATDFKVEKDLDKVKPPKKKTPRARMYYIVISDRFGLQFAYDVCEDFKKKFLPLCSELGKHSPYKEKISLHDFTPYGRWYYEIDIFATKDNFAKILDTIEYEKISIANKTHYKFIRYKEEM